MVKTIQNEQNEKEGDKKGRKTKRQIRSDGLITFCTAIEFQSKIETGNEML